MTKLNKRAHTIIAQTSQKRFPIRNRGFYTWATTTDIFILPAFFFFPFKFILDCGSELHFKTGVTWLLHRRGLGNSLWKFSPKSRFHFRDSNFCHHSVNKSQLSTWQGQIHEIILVRATSGLLSLAFMELKAAKARLTLKLTLFSCLCSY